MKRFHRMEIENNLFSLGIEEGFPLWDMLRVYIYNYYIKGSNPSHNQGNALKSNFVKTCLRSLRYLIKSICDCCRLPFYRGRIFIYESAIEKDDKGLHYNHITRQLLEHIPSEDRIVVNCKDTSPTYFRDFNINILGVFKLFSLWEKPLREQDYHVIRDVIRMHFNREIPYNTLNDFYLTQRIRFKRYSFLFWLLKPSKVVVSCDIRKYIYHAAKKRGIETFEMQHAGIVFDYPSYSYPEEVTKDWNIAFADNYLQFGSAWSDINNIPARRLVIGNDYFFPQAPVRYFKEDYFLFISNFKHAYYLKPLAQEVARLKPDYLIVYKLHPNEFNRVDEYKEYFHDTPNVRIACNKLDLQGLIAFTSMVVVIYSSVCFEALNQGKKVAIMKRDNFHLLNDTLKGSSLVRYIDNAEEIIEFDKCDMATGVKSAFYSHFDESIASSLFVAKEKDLV